MTAENPYPVEVGEVVGAQSASVELERRASAGLPVERVAALPAVQAAAVAATGFAAGAVAVAVMSRGRGRGRRLPLRRKRKSALGQIVSSNSFLVDVHVLKR